MRLANIVQGSKVVRSSVGTVLNSIEAFELPLRLECYGSEIR